MESRSQVTLDSLGAFLPRLLRHSSLNPFQSPANTPWRCHGGRSANCTYCPAASVMHHHNEHLDWRADVLTADRKNEQFCTGVRLFFCEFGNCKAKLVLYGRAALVRRSASVCTTRIGHIASRLGRSHSSVSADAVGWSMKII